MKIIKSPQAMRLLSDQWRSQIKRIGFVPTMGYLHQGHASLLKRCRQDNDIVVLSIFVNPTQFGPKEDFLRYPKDFKKDQTIAIKEKVDIIFVPSIIAMYPQGYKTFVEVSDLSTRLCGQFRHGHFKGVSTVVAKLLNIVYPDVLYLGQKDAQQALIIQKMVLDLNFNLKVKVCPTLREKDGLAMSSRNVYLTSNQRQEAPILFKALHHAKDQILSGQRKSTIILQQIKSLITQFSSGRIEYVECVQMKSLQPVETIQGKVLIALAVWFGSARLIDNIVVDSHR